MENRLDVFQEGPFDAGESCGAIKLPCRADRVLVALRDAIPPVLIFFFFLRVTGRSHVLNPRKVAVVLAIQEGVEFWLEGVVQADEPKNFKKHCKTTSKTL